MAIGRVAFGDDLVELVHQRLDVRRVVDAAFDQQIPHPPRGIGQIIAIGVHIADRAEQEAFHRAFAGKNVHHAAGCLHDVIHPGHIHAGFLDVAHLSECGREPCHQRRRHVAVGRDRVVVQHDRNGHSVADRPVIFEDLVIRGRVIIGRDDHQAIGAQILRLAAVAHRVGRIGVHRADHHLIAATRMAHGRINQQAALFVADGQELASGAQHDHTGHARFHLPIQKGVQPADVDAAAVIIERCDGNGVAAPEIFCHHSALDSCPLFLKAKCRPC